MKEIKIICDSEITIRNIKTGHVYKNEEEVKADVNEAQAWYFIKV